MHISIYIYIRAALYVLISIYIYIPAALYVHISLMKQPKINLQILNLQLYKVSVSDNMVPSRRSVACNACIRALTPSLLLDSYNSILSINTSMIEFNFVLALKSSLWHNPLCVLLLTAEEHNRPRTFSSYADIDTVMLYFISLKPCLSLQVHALCDLCLWHSVQR